MNNPFKRKPLPEVSLTSDAYRRWLRAHSPQPLSFFLGLTEIEQETLAGLGEEYDEDSFIAQAWAHRDPEAAAFGATDEDDDEVGLDLEASMAQRMTANILAQTVQAAHEAPGSTPLRDPPTMGGISKRRAATERDAKTAYNEGRRLMGRAPDEVKA